MKSQIGKYHIDQWNDGSWVVSWKDFDNINHVIHTLNLESILDDLTRPHQEHVHILAHYFQAAMTDDTTFLDLPGSGVILEHLPHVDIPPGWEPMSKRQRLTWHLQQFIEAYASMTGVRLQEGEMEFYLRRLI